MAITRGDGYIASSSSSARCSGSLCRNRTIEAPCPAAYIAPSYIVLWARPSRKIVPSPTSTGITDVWMWVIVGSTSTSGAFRSSVICSSISGYILWIAQEARPRRVRSPLREVLGHRRDDLLVEVEAEVVAAGEVRQPPIADPDPATPLLLDDRVHHRVGVREPREVRDRQRPSIEPAVVLSTTRFAVRRREGSLDRRALPRCFRGARRPCRNGSSHGASPSAPNRPP